MVVDIKKVLESNKAEIDAKIEEFIPKKLTREAMEKICGKARYAYDVETASQCIHGPAWDLLSRGGKRWRPGLFLLSHEAFGGDAKKVMDFVLIPEVVHNGTLMIDDIEDDSALRRGQPCTHKKYGVDVAINAGNAMYYLPLLALIKNKGKFPDAMLLKAYEVYSQEMINISYGQGMDIWWHRGNKYDVSEQEYLQMCAYKTGTLARMSAKIGALLAGANDEQVEAIGKFAETIGVAFQIQDDILNLTGEEFAKGKGRGEDIHEGKRTLMAIYCLSKADKKDAARLREILLQHPDDQKVIDEAIAIIEKYGGIKYSAKRAEELVEIAWKELEPLVKQSPAKEALKAFAEYLIKRSI
ncbi:MAG: polyprenyl synthetase family protein [Candidatus Micrarchaeota archaeon]